MQYISKYTAYYNATGFYNKWVAYQPEHQEIRITLRPSPSDAPWKALWEWLLAPEAGECEVPEAEVGDQDSPDTVNKD